MRKIVIAVALLALAGCARQPGAEKRELTQRQRDSILAREPIPGAGAVGGALEASDRGADAAARMNAQVDSLPR